MCGKLAIHQLQHSTIEHKKTHIPIISSQLQSFEVLHCLQPLWTHPPLPTALPRATVHLINQLGIYT